VVAGVSGWSGWGSCRVEVRGWIVGGVWVGGAGLTGGLEGLGGDWVLVGLGSQWCGSRVVAGRDRVVTIGGLGWLMTCCRGLNVPVMSAGKSTGPSFLCEIIGL
jgi:hypothetical protein